MRKKTIERSVYLGVLLLAAQYWIVSGTFAQTVPTTAGLDFDQVNFVVVAQPEHRERLYSRALRQLRESGIYKEGSGHGTKKSATLTLTLKPEQDTCPGKVLYAPSLMLREEVIVERNGVSMQDVTWSSKRAPYPVLPPSIQEIEAELDGLIAGFIVNYKMGNPTVSSQKELGEAGEPKNGSKKPAPGVNSSSTLMSGLSSDASLRGLSLENVNFVLWAGASTKALNARVIKRAAKAGLKLVAKSNAKTPATLTLRLDHRSLDEVCPGKFLYEASFELVEQVKIKRNPATFIWSTTWSKHKTYITDQVSLKQLETDADEFVDQFAASYKREIR